MIGNIRNKYVCFDCRVSFKGPLGASTGSTHCGRCGKPGTYVQPACRIPAKKDSDGWAKLRKWSVDFNKRATSANWWRPDPGFVIYDPQHKLG